MHHPQRFLAPAGTAILTLAATLTALAAAPEAPWHAQDIGKPRAAGSADFDAGTGIWTLQSSGDYIQLNADNFQFAYQPVTGDASITARILSRTGGSGWANTGLMIRENDTPGSPNLNFSMTGESGITVTVRSGQDEGTSWFRWVGPSTSRQNNTFMRLQRVGQEIAGFYSADGRIWSQAAFSPQTLPTLKTEALIGLAVSSGQPGSRTTGHFDQVVIQPELSAYGIRALGGDRSVTLQWHPLPGALGFHLARGPDKATADQFVKVTDRLIAGTTYTDTADGLVNGTPVTYLLTPVFRKAADGTEVEGLPVAVRALPITAPPDSGLTGCSIDETTRFGSAALDPATGEIILRGGGTDIWDPGDQCYFLQRLVEGDFQVTVKAVTKPTALDVWTKAGLMIRESLDGSARAADLVVTPGGGLAFQYRRNPSTLWEPEEPQIPDAKSLKVPITIRLTRRGRTITPEYSLDDGKSFLPSLDPVTFEQGLPRALYVGLAITAHDPNGTATARFTNLTIQPLQ